MDIQFFLQWWLMLFMTGILALPITARLFNNFPDKGYAFTKIIGLILFSYTIFILSTLRLFDFSIGSLLLISVALMIVSYFILRSRKNSLLEDILLFSRKNWRFIAIEEFLFLIILIFWSYTRSFTPEINGLEKFMDVGFVNSILKSSYFPPKDMWLAPFTINYYYFGHLITAVATKLSFVPISYSYNLMIASLAALTFIQSFSIGTLLITNVTKKLSTRKILASGILTAMLVTFSGNLHTIYLFFNRYQSENPEPFWKLAFSPFTFPNAYWYPDATRFIFNTIHEFPIYSWTVSDLHGHVLDIPIVLLTIAILYQLFIVKIVKTKRKQSSNKLIILQNKFAKYSEIPLELVLLIGFLLSVMYMTNAWDGLIYLLLSFLIILFRNLEILSRKLSLTKRFLLITKKSALPLLIIIICFAIFSLPFSLNFKPFVSGIGVLCAPSFLTNIGQIGPLLFESDHCQKSPLWQLAILYGFFSFYAIVFILFIRKLKRVPSDYFVLLLLCISYILILVPEFIYAKDIYPAHYRANTMFKLVFESFIMLSLSTGYIIARISTLLKSNYTIKGTIYYLGFFVISLLLLVLIFLYPYFAITSFYGNVFSLTTPKEKTLDGFSYMKQKYPDDYEGIIWLQKNIKGQPVILEAQGDSYTDYGRVSVYTGLPTVLGWTVHEWLWRGDYSVPSPRIDEIKQLYESQDLELTKQLLNKYSVEYIYIGSLEQSKYEVFENKFKQLGRLVYDKNSTRIYKL